MSHRYQTLISPFVLPNGVVLKDRMVHPKCAPDQTQGPEDWPTEQTAFFYSDAARRGNALVMMHVRNSPDVRKLPDDHDFAHSYTFDTNNPGVQNYICQIVEDVHAYGSKIVGVVAPEFPRGKSLGGKGAKFMQQSEGFFPLPPSEPATSEEIKASIEEAVKECIRLKNWNFDGIAVGINGLDARMDIRTDEYGGSPINRARFTLEFCEAVKKACGSKFIVHAQVNGVPAKEDARPEDIEFGYTLDDLAEVLKAAEGIIDLVSIREPTMTECHPTGYTMNKHEHRCVGMCRYLKAAGIQIPLAVSGGFQDPDEMETLLRSGVCDLISIGRGLFTDPDYYAKVIEERGEDIRPCVKCNRCHGKKRAPWTSLCTVNPSFGSECKDKYLCQSAGRSRKVAVIGGGPAGLQAAITAAERGHDVTLYEKSDSLGGQLRHGKYFSFKWPFGELLDWLIRQCEQKGVKIVRNCEPTPEEISEGGYYAVIAAAGSVPLLPNIEGMYRADGTPALKTCHEVIGHEDDLPENLIMVGCSETGIETACYLAQSGHKITCLTRQSVLAKDASPLHSITIAWDRPAHPMTGEPYLAPYWERFEDVLTGITEATTTRVTPTSVTYLDKAGTEHTLQADQVIVCGGVQPNLTGALKYSGCAPLFRMVGDVDGNVDMAHAFRSGFIAASQI